MLVLFLAIALAIVSFTAGLWVGSAVENKIPPLYYKMSSTEEYMEYVKQCELRRLEARLLVLKPVQEDDKKSSSSGYASSKK